MTNLMRFGTAVLDMDRLVAAVPLERDPEIVEVTLAYGDKLINVLLGSRGSNEFRAWAKTLPPAGAKENDHAA